MPITKCPSRALKGLSFEISDLILIQDRAQEAYPVHSGPSICSSGGVVAVRAGQAH
jgi:hypothetical protein